MLEHFFQLGPLPHNEMLGSYDWRLVTLSYLVATLASYIALDLAARLRDLSTTNSSLKLWIFGGAFAMGAGIWSMHFIGMLAFSMPMAMGYDLVWTTLSLFVAIIASAFALYLLKTKVLSHAHIFVGGIVLGCAIATMHYTGMAAMTDDMVIRYTPGLFLLSILIAIVASQAALLLALKNTQVAPALRYRTKLLSALIMGAAICGMHYTGMAAAVFTPLATMSSHLPAPSLNNEVLAISIAGITVVILGVALLASLYKETLNQHLLLAARQAGKAEVASSVLHNVGNVLNSVNVSSTLLVEKISQSKLSELVNLSQLINENKDNLSEFIKTDPRGAQLPEFLASLAKYWVAEKEKLSVEAEALNKNVKHIKDIIATQQGVSRSLNVVQLESIKMIVDESILISGLEERVYGIHLTRHYEKLDPVFIDKSKLLQILVNLFKNAKDAIHESHKNEKEILISLSHDEQQFRIRVTDTGVGILPEDLTRIFNYGYTTKRQGHGFGLHSCAIAAKEMGGSLCATSAGKQQGATFYLDLPYILEKIEA